MTKYFQRQIRLNCSEELIDGREYIWSCSDCVGRLVAIEMWRQFAIRVGY